MIEASFERLAERSAAVSGAYQYDTGQRLKMHGLPALVVLQLLFMLFSSVAEVCG